MAEDKNNKNKYDPYRSSDTGDDDVGGGLANLQHALQATSLNGIFGAPYQFLQSVDRRIEKKNSGSLGRKYAEKIMTHAPLLLITPCRQKFMEGFSTSDQESVLSGLISGDSSPADTHGTGRYYTSEFADAEYYRCVNHMCAEVSRFLGIGDKKYFGNTRIDAINWRKYKNTAFAKYFAAKRSVVFYADGLVSLQDSFGNSTTESSLASTINSFGDQARELKFLLGGNGALNNLYDKLSQAGTDVMGSVTSGLSNLGVDMTQGMLGDLANTGVSVALNGGKMIFPKLWGDSQSSRSYSFDIKLRSPDHDNISIFMNILVPYIHLLALCLPQSMTRSSAAQSPNAYDTPFILRAYCKGMFNINMGIVTDLSCTRGAEAQWNNAGLPTQMDVSLSIEDLYSTLVMTNTKGTNIGLKENIIGNALDIVTNTEMIDFLSNLSGLNVACEEQTRRVKLVSFVLGDHIRRIPENVYMGIENGVSNMIRRYFYDKLRT